MSDPTEPKDSELLVELSDQEQETVVGGSAMGGLASFFFQQTDIESFADSQINFSGHDNSGSSSSRARYRFSQTTFGFSFLPFNRRSRHRGRGMMGNIFNLFQEWTG